MNVATFEKLPLLGILRGISQGSISPLIEAIEASGLETIEITMNTEGAPALIRKAKTISKKNLTIGAGTVLTMESLGSALDAGATFIVMPVLIKEIVEYCLKHKIPVFPGALSPKEIYEGKTSWFFMEDLPAR